MDTLKAFEKSRAAAGKPHMVFDWDKAARIIAERQPGVARAGLRGDWEYTGGDIYRHGSPVPKNETYTFLSSNWAVPELDIDGEIIECFAMESDTEWGSDTYWPGTAVRIINQIEGRE